MIFETLVTFAPAPRASEDDACAAITFANFVPSWRSAIFVFGDDLPLKNCYQLFVMLAEALARATRTDAAAPGALIVATSDATSAPEAASCEARCART